MALRNQIKKKIQEKKNTNKHLGDTGCLIRCDKGHALGIQQGKPDDLKDDDYIPICAKCRQPNLLAHSYYYRCFHADCRSHGCHYSMCQCCVFIEQGSLAKEMKCDFYDGVLTRHSINNSSYQWTCHTQTPRMQEWMKSLRIKNLEMKCANGIDGVVRDNTKY